MKRRLLYLTARWTPNVGTFAISGALLAYLLFWVPL